jgi:hypothetical protein
MYTSIASLIRKVSLVFLIVTFIFGIVVGNVLSITSPFNNYEKSFNWTSAIIIWMIGILFSGICYAVGAILDLSSRTFSALENISYDLKVISQNTTKLAAELTERSEGAKRTDQENLQLEPPSDIGSASQEKPSTPFVVLGDGQIKCSHCGKIQRSDRIICYFCGQKFSAPEAEH